MLCAIRLSRGKGVIEIIALQPDLDRIAPKHTGLLNLLLWGCHRHKDHTPDAKVPAHERNPLRVISSRGADKQPPVRISGQHLAHRIEGPAQLVGSHRRQIFALQPDISLKTVRQMRVAQQGRGWENLTHGAFGCAGLILKLGHSRSLAQLGHSRKAKLQLSRYLALPHKTR